MVRYHMKLSKIIKDRFDGGEQNNGVKGDTVLQ